MVITKSVPLAISRKKFSNFDLHTNPENVVFVGYKTVEDESNEGKEKNVNVRLNYSFIKEDIIKTIKKDPQWGQGGGSIVSPEIPVSPVTPDALEIFSITITEFDNDEPIRVPIEDGGTWDTENKTNFLDVKEKQTIVEINAGGKYTSDYIYIHNPMNGSVSHIVVDNTGLPQEYGESIPPTDNFTLYYGGEGNCYEILSVPPMCRGIVQVLHSKNMDMDFVLYASYTEVPNNGFDFIRYVPDEQNESDEFDNTPVDKSPTMVTNADTFYIDMNEEKGFFEFYTREHDSYTFVFSTPELGSSTYIVVNNTNDFYHGHPVSIRYGKFLDINNNGIQDDNDLEIVYEITEIDNEIAIIEVFHSLSADIVVKITKV